jgi:multifunctional methyltransferase subunit TRM112
LPVDAQFSFRTTEGYPLKIEAMKVVVEESTMDSVLVSKMLNKLNYPALVAAIADVKSSQSIGPSISAILSQASDIPSEPPEDGESVDVSTLKALHFFLFDVHVLEGILQCPDTGRKFPIKDGIPNMILHEDEI